MFKTKSEPLSPKEAPPKRTRQAANSPAGGSDTTELEETVTMEVIARTLKMQLQQEPQVLTGDFNVP